jgi:hypothetical protein
VDSFLTALFQAAEGLDDEAGGKEFAALVYALENVLRDVDGHRLQADFYNCDQTTAVFISKFNQPSPVFARVIVWDRVPSPNDVTVKIEAVDEFHGPGTPGSGAKTYQETLENPDQEEVWETLRAIIAKGEERKLEQGEALNYKLEAMHENWYYANLLQQKFSGKAEAAREDAITRASVLAEKTGRELSRTLKEWLDAHEGFDETHGPIIENAGRARDRLDKALRSLPSKKSAPEGEEWRQREVRLDKMQDRMREAVSAVSVALNVAHQNGIISESLGITEQMLNDLSDMDLGGVEWKASKYLSWVGRHCKFARNDDLELQDILYGLRNFAELEPTEARIKAMLSVADKHHLLELMADIWQEGHGVLSKPDRIDALAGILDA